MNTVIREHSERVSVEIKGREPVRGLTYHEALQLIDDEYIQDIRGTVKRMEAYRQAAEAGLVQASNALDKLKRECQELLERHPGGEFSDEG